MPRAVDGINSALIREHLLCRIVATEPASALVEHWQIDRLSSGVQCFIIIAS